MRSSTITRESKETNITVQINLDGSGKTQLQTGVGFFDHMLDALSRFAQMDLTVCCRGDLQVDAHHTVEDVGICLGKAFAQALGDKRGITRYGFFILPMDEALILSAVDISGRCHLGYDLGIPTQKIGSFDTELVEEFLLGFVRSCPMSLHVKKMEGTNAHHIVEGAFKSLARSLKAAVAIDPTAPNAVPSTKGVLE